MTERRATQGPASGALPARLDLRGLLCPLTWARTKYALGKAAPGAELLVIVDHRPAVPDIKRNAEELGHEVVETREIEGPAWELLVRKQ